MKGDVGPKALGEEDLPDISIEAGVFGEDGQFRGVLWEITDFLDRIQDAVPVLLGDIIVHAHFLKREKGLGEKNRDDTAEGGLWKLCLWVKFEGIKRKGHGVVAINEIIDIDSKLLSRLGLAIHGRVREKASGGNSGSGERGGGSG